jgi:hypothetical protein
VYSYDSLVAGDGGSSYLADLRPVLVESSKGAGKLAASSRE